MMEATESNVNVTFMLMLSVIFNLFLFALIEVSCCRCFFYEMIWSILTATKLVLTSSTPIKVSWVLSTPLGISEKRSG